MNRDAHPEPTVAEIAALTARLRSCPRRGRGGPAERARFLADKDALIARITAAARHADPPPRGRAEAWATGAAEDALTEVVRARAADGYALVGPSARPGAPTRHRAARRAGRRGRAQALRQLMGREEFTAPSPHGTTARSSAP